MAWALLLGRMAPRSIDLDAQIENLRGLKCDLEEHYWSVAEAADGRTCYALEVAIEQLGHRIGTLEGIVRHHGGDEVTVGPSTVEESRALDRALAVLDGEFVVDPGSRDSRLWPRVRALLGAADELLFAAARGTLVRALEQDGAPRPGIVVPLARSSR